MLSEATRLAGHFLQHLQGAVLFLETLPSHLHLLLKEVPKVTEARASCMLNRFSVTCHHFYMIGLFVCLLWERGHITQPHSEGQVYHKAQPSAARPAE